MSRDRLDGALEHGLRAAYWAIAVVIVGVAIAMMLTLVGALLLGLALYLSGSSAEAFARIGGYVRDRG